MAELKTDYKDQLLDSLVNTKRVYNLVDADGNVVRENVSLEDVTVYSQDGDNFGAADINKTNEEVNQLNRNFNNELNNILIIHKLSSTAGSSGSTGVEIPYPDGFNINNTFVLSVNASYSNLKLGIGYQTELSNFPVYAKLTNSGISVGGDGVVANQPVDILIARMRA